MWSHYTFASQLEAKQLRIDRHVNNASLSLRGQRSRVLGERLRWDMASVVHFIEVSC